MKLKSPIKKLKKLFNKLSKIFINEYFARFCWKAVELEWKRFVQYSIFRSYQISGYTVVPASVSFRGVSMKLDLKIDQKTLAAATNFSKVVEEAVSTHLSSSVIPVENDEVGSSLIPHIPPTSTTIAQPYHSVSSFTVMEPANSTKESPVCDSSVESSTALLVSISVFIMHEFRNFNY